MPDPRLPLRRLLALANAGASIEDRDLDDVAAEVFAAQRHIQSEPDTEAELEPADPMVASLAAKLTGGRTLEEALSEKFPSQESQP